MFTRAQADGAIPNGTRVRKVVSDPGDTHPVGSVGIVLGSFAAPEPVPAFEHVRHFYFIEWQQHPRVAMGITDFKVRPLAGGE